VARIIVNIEKLLQNNHTEYNKQSNRKGIF